MEVSVSAGFWIPIGNEIRPRYMPAEKREERQQAIYMTGTGGGIPATKGRMLYSQAPVSGGNSGAAIL
ncbi:hypothetical protein DFR47_104528 [Pseudochrobactrum asaccharolyticum]|uniref:Uncharacterized protein n=1 Tax=Pseudochrobactrum asaccharolyticum TaxID=354351 RepID=A0A366E049_9HYPH|nr:hypothetical protein DFR47_104528 [Pseudochrobactrum asaccharolyticum]